MKYSSHRQCWGACSLRECIDIANKCQKTLGFTMPNRMPQLEPRTYQECGICQSCNWYRNVTTSSGPERCHIDSFKDTNVLELMVLVLYFCLMCEEKQANFSSVSSMVYHNTKNWKLNENTVTINMCIQYEYVCKTIILALKGLLVTIVIQTKQYYMWPNLGKT